MGTDPTNLRPGLTGGRVDHAGAFPDDQEQYRHLTPSERIALLRELNRRMFAIAEGRQERCGDRGISDRLVAAVEASGEPPDREQELAAVGFYERAYERRSLGVVTGVLGGVAVLTGLALRISGRRRAEALARVPVGPVIGPGHLGVVGQFAF